MKRDLIQYISWNEEYAIKAMKLTEYGPKIIKTPKGRGYRTTYEAEEEAKRLKSQGYTKISIYIQKWTKNI